MVGLHDRSAIEHDKDVEILVADSGPGIPPEVREKMFQSFFTTKPVGQGTGLGLRISRRIAESHQGSLDLRESSPNICFVLKLPRKKALA